MMPKRIIMSCERRISAGGEPNFKSCWVMAKTGGGSSASPAFSAGKMASLYE
jgi:hypothetical protein